MSWLGLSVHASPLRRRDEMELLDEPGLDQDELAKNLHDIRRVNRLLGGTSTMLRHVPRLLEATSAAPRPVTILDLATGSADIPLAIARWANTRDLAVTIIASDASKAILDVAREQIRGCPVISLARIDARQVPLPDQLVDIVLCSLALHHFPPDDAVRVLQEMNRLARIGFILNDLRRGRLGYVAAWVASRLTTRNRLTRNDAPLSVLRAYTPAELNDLLRRAGVADATISTHPWFRLAAVKTGAGQHE